MEAPEPTARTNPAVPLNEVIAAAVRRDIIEGRLAPGERLTEERLASQYGASRNPVREALRRLESEGFVVVRINRGATVLRLTEDEASNLLEVRAALETLMARRAAARRGGERLEQMRRVVAEGDDAVAANRLAELNGLNTRFHTLLGEASGNTVATAIMDRLHNKIEWVYASEWHAADDQAWSDHHALVDAIAAGDEDSAAALMAKHISDATAAYRVRHDHG